MGKTNPNGRTVSVPKISEKETLRRFENFLLVSLGGKKIDDKGQYVVLHATIPLPPNFETNVIVYSTDKIFISSSGLAEKSDFDKVADEIGEAAQRAKVSVKTTRPITLMKAKSLLDYAGKLDLDDENDRMVVVIISDTSNEIILTESMKSLGIKGPPLEEGIPQKIDHLKKKGQTVHKATEIKNARELRNEIVHNGNVPNKDQAESCLQTSNQFYESL
jgi:hypothetical protein